MNIDGEMKTVEVKVQDIVSIPDLESFNTREEYNRWKEEVSSFTNRNNQRFQFKKNPYDVVASNALIKKVARDTKQTQKLEKEFSAKMSGIVTAEGHTVGQQMLQMGRPNNIGMSRTPDFNFSKIRNSSDLQRKARNMIERSDPKIFDKRLVQMQENYIAMLERMYNSDADEVIDKIRHIPPDDFYQLYLIFFREMEFNEFYINEEFDSEWQNYYMNDLARVERRLDEYFLGNVNMDLKDF